MHEIKSEKGRSEGSGFGKSLFWRNNLMSIHRRKCAFFGVVCLVATLVFGAGTLSAKPPAPTANPADRFILSIGGRNIPMRVVGDLEFTIKGQNEACQPTTQLFHWWGHIPKDLDDVYDWKGGSTPYTMARQVQLPQLYKIESVSVKINNLKYELIKDPEVFGKAIGATLSTNGTSEIVFDGKIPLSFIYQVTGPCKYKISLTLSGNKAILVLTTI